MAPIKPVWYVKALEFNGLKEVPGKNSNVKIMGWAAAFGGWIKSFYTDDSIPWCGLGMGHCLWATIKKYPKNFLSARKWYDEDWGQKKLGKAPLYGCIAVFLRPGGAHVGIYIAEDDTAIRVYGFNQGDAVGYTWISKDRLYGYVWPPGVPLGATGRVIRKRTGTISTNEA